MKKIIFAAMLYANATMAQISDFPFTENFDNLTAQTSVADIPEDWAQFNLNDDFAYWDVIPNSVSFPNNARSAPNAMHMSFDFNQPANDWLITPAFTLQTGASYKVSFWYRSISGGFPGISEKMAFHLGTSAEPTGMATTPLWMNDDITSQVYALAEVEFVADDNAATTYFGFHGYSDAEQFLLAMDDFKIEKITNSATNDLGNNITISPNPCTQSCKIVGLETNSKVSIMNTNGQLLRQWQVNSGVAFSMEGLMAGVYVCRIEHEGRVIYKKIIKE